MFTTRMKPNKEAIFLSLGTNMGDRQQNLQKAINATRQLPISINQLSPVYSTAAWGKHDQDMFLNQVIRIETVLEPNDLLHALLNIEHDLGRLRSEKWGPRVIDIDILLYGQRVVHTDNLIVPHPRMTERKFVLVPLNDIAPSAIHPVSGKTIRQLLLECRDNLEVTQV